MQNIGPKLLVVAAIGLTSCVALTKANADVAHSKQQSPIRSSQEPSPSISAERIEGFDVVRTPGQIIAPRSLEAMIETADLIVIGRPSQSIAESTAITKRDSEGYLNTAASQTEFKVSQVLKGKLDSKNILVGQQAAIVKEKGDATPVLMVLEEYQPLVKNAKYILFLKKGLDGRPWYFPLGVYFGKINIDGNDQGEKKANYGQTVRVIQAGALDRYKKEVSQPD
jgi:hypothetical protein